MFDFSSCEAVPLLFIQNTDCKGQKGRERKTTSPARMCAMNTPLTFQEEELHNFMAVCGHHHLPALHSGLVVGEECGTMHRLTLQPWKIGRTCPWAPVWRLIGRAQETDPRATSLSQPSRLQRSTPAPLSACWGWDSGVTVIPAFHSSISGTGCSVRAKSFVGKGRTWWPLCQET